MLWHLWKLSSYFLQSYLNMWNVSFSPVRRSGCETGVQHHLIPHHPPRKQGGGEYEALNYPSPSTSSTFLSSFFSPSVSLSLHSCFFLSPIRHSGLWGVTLQESGCNNTAVICLDLIWSQSSWERCVERWIKKRQGRGKEKDRQRAIKETGEQRRDCVRDREALAGPWRRVLGFYLDPLGSQCGASVVLNLLTSPIKTQLLFQLE